MYYAIPRTQKMNFHKFKKRQEQRQSQQSSPHPPPPLDYYHYDDDQEYEYCIEIENYYKFYRYLIHRHNCNVNCDELIYAIVALEIGDEKDEEILEKHIRKTRAVIEIMRLPYIFEIFRQHAAVETESTHLRNLLAAHNIDFTHGLQMKIMRYRGSWLRNTTAREEVLIGQYLSVNEIVKKYIFPSKYEIPFDIRNLIISEILEKSRVK